MKMKQKCEAILVRKRGGKLVEIQLVPQGKQANASFKTDNRIAGSMETISLEKHCDLIEWLEKSGRIHEVEKMILAIFG